MMEQQKILDVNDIEPNKWNPNRLTDRQIEHLKRSMLKTEKLSPGGLQPILVMKIDGRDKYTIIDGENRWRERKFLAENGHPGFKKVSAIVIEGIDEDEAKVISLNMNKIRGQPDPILLAQLISDLHENMDYDELKEELDYDDIEVDAMEMMAEEPDFDEIDDDDLEIEEEDTRTWSCQVPMEEYEFVRDTIQDVQEEEQYKDRGDALIHVLKRYVEEEV